MSHWNHRVVKKVFNKGTKNEEEMFGIHEVFYNDKNEIYAYTDNPIDLQCESVEALREYIGWCMKALDKPIIIDGEIVFAKDDITEEELAEVKELLTAEEFEEELKKLTKDSTIKD